MDYRRFIQDLIDQAFYLPRAAILALPAFFTWLFWKENKGRIREKLRNLAGRRRLFAFFFYGAFILCSTVMGRERVYPLGAVTSHLFPGKDARAWQMNLENMLMFLPYTFLYLNAFQPRKPWVSSLRLAIGTSVFIEAFQLLCWLGMFQISDIVYNTAGGVLGTVIWILWTRIRR